MPRVPLPSAFVSLGLRADVPRSGDGSSAFSLYISVTTLLDQITLACSEILPDLHQQVGLCRRIPGVYANGFSSPFRDYLMSSLQVFQGLGAFLLIKPASPVAICFWQALVGQWLAVSTASVVFF